MATTGYEASYWPIEWNTMEFQLFDLLTILDLKHLLVLTIFHPILRDHYPYGLHDVVVTNVAVTRSRRPEHVKPWSFIPRDSLECHRNMHLLDSKMDG